MKEKVIVPRLLVHTVFRIMRKMLKITNLLNPASHKHINIIILRFCNTLLLNIKIATLKHLCLLKLIKRFKCSVIIKIERILITTTIFFFTSKDLSYSTSLIRIIFTYLQLYLDNALIVNK